MLKAFANIKEQDAVLEYDKREELRDKGIRVIAVLPGSTDTPIWNSLWPEAPRHKMIRPETVADALVSALMLPPESTVEELAIMPTGGPL